MCKCAGGQRAFGRSVLDSHVFLYFRHLLGISYTKTVQTLIVIAFELVVILILYKCADSLIGHALEICFKKCLGNGVKTSKMEKLCFHTLFIILRTLLVCTTLTVGALVNWIFASCQGLCRRCNCYLTPGERELTTLLALNSTPLYFLFDPTNLT